MLEEQNDNLPQVDGEQNEVSQENVAVISQSALEEIDNSNAEENEDDSVKDKHDIPMLEYDTLSKEELTNELETLIANHKVMAIKDHVEEIKKKHISKLNICWIGDSNNVLNSLIAASVKFSFKLNIACPKNYEPKKFVIDWAKNNKGKIFIFNDAKKAVKNADVIFSDKVISLNDNVNKINKIRAFNNFKINSKLISFAKKDVTFLHCLPRGEEVTDEVFLGKNSEVWLQALNRVHVQKSILLYCFEKLR